MSSLLQDLSSAIAGPLGQLGNALAEIERLGGAERLAGDPAALRRAASAWRQQAAALGELEGELERQVGRTLSESWQGPASQAFAGNWHILRGKLRDLAAGYERMAAGLEQAAGRAGGLNAQAAALVAEMGSLLGALRGVQGLAAVAGLASRAGALLVGLEELLRQVEAAWAEWLSWALAMTLWFQHLLQTMPRVQPVAVPRPGWQIGARLRPGGAAIELRPSAGVDAGPGRLRKGPPADAGSLWRWLLVLLAILAGQDAGVLARLLARATSESDPKRQSGNVAAGEPAFGGPPQLGPPDEPPKNDKGEIDWAAWEARLRQKDVGGDLAERIDAAKRGVPGAIEELTAAERFASAGYRVRFIKPVENVGRTNPDMQVQFPGERESGGKSPLRVEVKSGRLTKRGLDTRLDAANRQIKLAEGNSDPATVAQQQGYILHDASRAPAAGQLDQTGVEAYLRGKMTVSRLRQIRFLEVLYRDNGVLKRTFMFRNADGSVTGPVTEQLSPK